MGQNSYEDDSECHTFEETPMCKKPPLDTSLKVEDVVGRFHSLGLTARTIACKINLHGESHCPQVNILRKPGVQLCERQDKSGNGKLVNFDQS